MLRWTAIALIIAATGGSEVVAQCVPFSISEVQALDTVLCEGDSVSFNIIGSFDPDSVRFQWQEFQVDWSALPDDTLDNVFVAPDENTMYRCLVVCGDDTLISDTVSVIVHPLPQVAATADPAGPFCGVAQTTLATTIDASYTYSWLPTGGLEPNNEGVVLCSTNSSATYIVTVTDTNACIASDSVTIVVLQLPSVTVPGDLLICATDTSATLLFLFDGAAPFSFTLQTPTDTIITTNYQSGTLVIDSLVEGEYLITALNDTGCAAADPGDTVLVGVVDPLASITAIAIEDTICQEDIAELIGNDPGLFDGLWTIVNGPITDPDQLTGASNDSAFFDPVSSGLYNIQWIISGSTCPALDTTITVLVIELSDPANAGPDTSMCAEGSISLSGSDASPGVGTWSILSGPDLDPAQIGDIHSSTSAFTPNGGGNYTLQWNVDDPPCTADADQINILVIQPDSLPTIIGMDDLVACHGEYQTFIIPDNISGTWFSEHGVFDSLMGDTVTVHWLYPQGSTDTISTTVTVTLGGGCPVTTTFDFQLVSSPASCPRGIVYFAPQGLAILDLPANHYQWGRIAAGVFEPDPTRTDQTTFDAVNITGCEPYYVVRTSITGNECWSTTLLCATQEMVDRPCLVRSMVEQDLHVRAYPNPSGGGPVTVEAIGESDLPLRLELSDMCGRSLYSGVLPLTGVSTLLLDLDPLQRGVYVLRAWNTDFDRAIKLVID